MLILEEYRDGLVHEVTSGSGAPVQALAAAPAARGVVRRARDVLRQAFLPENADSLPQDYYRFQTWDTVQSVCYYARSSLTAEAVLAGVGVGQEGASALGAAFAFFLKDAVASVGGVAFSYAQGASLDAQCKQWRLLGEALGNVGMVFELAAPLAARWHGGFLVACLALGSLARTVVWMTSGATRAALTTHFARGGGNSADLAAKEASQDSVSCLVGMALGMAATVAVRGRPVAAWLVFLALTALQMVCSILAVRSVALSTLNASRLQLLLRHYVASTASSAAYASALASALASAGTCTAATREAPPQLQHSPGVEPSSSDLLRACSCSDSIAATGTIDTVSAACSDDEDGAPPALCRSIAPAAAEAGEAGEGETCNMQLPRTPGSSAPSSSPSGLRRRCCSAKLGLAGGSTYSAAAARRSSSAGGSPFSFYSNNDDDDGDGDENANEQQPQQQQVMGPIVSDATAGGCSGCVLTPSAVASAEDLILPSLRNCWARLVAALTAPFPAAAAAAATEQPPAGVQIVFGAQLSELLAAVQQQQQQQQQQDGGYCDGGRSSSPLPLSHEAALSAALQACGSGSAGYLLRLVGRRLLVVLDRSAVEGADGAADEQLLLLRAYTHAQLLALAVEAAERRTATATPSPHTSSAAASSDVAGHCPMDLQVAAQAWMETCFAGFWADLQRCGWQQDKSWPPRPQWTATWRRADGPSAAGSPP